MQLPSRLGQTTLGDVLGALYREGATGTLELTEAPSLGGRMHRVHFRDGLIQAVETAGTVARLGEILQREGWVGAPAKGFAERLARLPSEQPLGERLVAARLLTQDELASALRLQQKDRLERLYRVGDARLAFRIARYRPRGTAPGPLEPREFLHGRPRARDDVDAPRRSGSSLRQRALRTLGLPEAASSAEVKQAFRSLAARTHPDRFPEAGPDEKAALLRRFAELSAAYHAVVA
jgi:DnaJ-domain-containing protein 1